MRMTPAVVPSHSAPPITVLVVEDELLIRMIIVDHLREEGYFVVEAGDVEHAKTLFITSDVDVLFTDVNMPGALDGYDLAHWAQVNYPAVETLITSGKVRSCEELGKMPAGVPVIPKPYDVFDIEKRIRTLMMRH